VPEADAPAEPPSEAHRGRYNVRPGDGRSRCGRLWSARSLPPVPEPTPPAFDAADGELPYADLASPTEQKIALFRALFAGRTDVYATRWVSTKSGRTGWSPAEDNPFAKNKNESERAFWPLSDQAVYQHLSRPDPGRREMHLGLYPLLADDTCSLLVCDFDGKDGSDWRGDAGAYLAACRDNAVPALLEISRSGSGAHVWIFDGRGQIPWQTIGEHVPRLQSDVLGLVGNPALEAGEEVQ
jgi:hypothetical protein